MREEQFKINEGWIIVTVSVFSGMDLMLLGAIRAGMLPGFACEANIYAAEMHRHNFFHPDGTPVIAGPIEITKEEYKVIKHDPVRRDQVMTKDGKFYRSIRIQEVDGRVIRRQLEERYGKKIIICLLGGPPCQSFTNLSQKGRHATGTKDERNSRHLVLEYARIVRELEPDFAIMEEVPDILKKKHNLVFDEFLDTIRRLPYQCAYRVLNSIHYKGRQNRNRFFMVLVRDTCSRKISFPEPDTENITVVKDFLPHVAWHYVHSFGAGFKSSNQMMCTVVSIEPKWFKGEDGHTWEPTFNELLKCFCVEDGEYIIPEKLPKSQIRKAIGNAVCAATSEAICRTIINDTLGYVKAEDGLWYPIDDAEKNGGTFR